MDSPTGRRLSDGKGIAEECWNNNAERDERHCNRVRRRIIEDSSFFNERVWEGGTVHTLYSVQA